MAGFGRGLGMGRGCESGESGERSDVERMVGALAQAVQQGQETQLMLMQYLQGQQQNAQIGLCDSFAGISPRLQRVIWNEISVARTQGRLLVGEPDLDVLQVEDVSENRGTTKRAFTPAESEDHSRKKGKQVSCSEDQQIDQGKKNGFCLKCKKPYHAGKFCDGTLRRCFACREVGHFARDCPMKNASTTAVVTPMMKGKQVIKDLRSELCWKCGKPYHRGMNCDGSPVGCFRCKEAGHLAKDCPSKNVVSTPVVTSVPEKTCVVTCDGVETNPVVIAGANSVDLEVETSVVGEYLGI